MDIDFGSDWGAPIGSFDELSRIQSNTNERDWNCLVAAPVVMGMQFLSSAGSS